MQTPSNKSLSISDQFEIRQTITFRLNHSLPFHDDPDVQRLAAVAPDVAKLAADDKRLWEARLQAATASSVADAVKLKAKLAQVSKPLTVEEIIAESRKKGRDHNRTWASQLGFHPDQP